MREKNELAAKGSIPHTLNVPMSGFEQSFALPEGTFSEQFGAARPEQGDPVVTFCAIGVRSEKARSILIKKFGYTNVANYKGSFTEWKEMMEGGGAKNFDE